MLQEVGQHSSNGHFDGGCDRGSSPRQLVAGAAAFSHLDQLAAVDESLEGCECGLSVEAGSFSHGRVCDGAVLGGAQDDVVDLVVGVADPRRDTEAGRDVVGGAAALSSSNQDTCIDERLQ